MCHNTHCESIKSLMVRLLNREGHKEGSSIFIRTAFSSVQMHLLTGVLGFCYDNFLTDKER